jgi:hypothetical protein
MVLTLHRTRLRRGAFYLACMVAGVAVMLLFYFWSEQVWALWVWLWT